MRITPFLEILRDKKKIVQISILVGESLQSLNFWGKFNCLLYANIKSGTNLDLKLKNRKKIVHFFILKKVNIF